MYSKRKKLEKRTSAKAGGYWCPAPDCRARGRDRNDPGGVWPHQESQGGRAGKESKPSRHSPSATAEA